MMFERNFLIRTQTDNIDVCGDPFTYIVYRIMVGELKKNIFVRIMEPVVNFVITEYDPTNASNQGANSTNSTEHDRYC